MKLAEGHEINGFIVKRVTPLPELFATLFQLEHHRTGAHYIHIANGDDREIQPPGFARGRIDIARSSGPLRSTSATRIPPAVHEKSGMNPREAV